MRSSKCLVGALAIAVVAGACGSSSKSSSGASPTAATAAAPSGTPIVLMQILTQSGPSDNVPEDFRASQAAAKAINATGGIQGHPLQIVACDDKFDPNAAAACARQAVSQKVTAILALNSGFGDKIIPITSAAGIPSVGDNLITPAEFLDKLVFPVSGGALTGTAAMAWATAHAGAKKIRPMIVDIPAAKGLLPFVKGAVALFPRSQLLSEVDVPATAADVTSQASAAAAGSADGAFFVVGQGATAPIVRALKTAGFSGTMTGSTQSITLKEISDLGSQAEGVQLISSMPPPDYTTNPSVKQFNADMDALGDKSDSRTGGMLLAWASTKVSAMVLSKAQSFDAAGMVAALNSYGPLTFSGLGSWDWSKPLQAFGGKLRIFNPDVYVSKVHNGKVVPIAPDPFDVTAAPTS